MDIELKARLIEFFDKLSGIEKVEKVLTKTEINDRMYHFENEAFELGIELRKSFKLPHAKAEFNELAPIFKSLSSYQMEHYETVFWLLNPQGPRAVGKTHLMALAFIEHSLYHGMWVDIFNHNVQAPYSISEIMVRVQEIVESIPGLILLIRKHPRTSIRVRRKSEEITRRYITK